MVPYFQGVVPSMLPRTPLVASKSMVVSCRRRHWKARRQHERYRGISICYGNTLNGLVKQYVSNNWLILRAIWSCWIQTNVMYLWCMLGSVLLYRYQPTLYTEGAGKYQPGNQQDVINRLASSMRLQSFGSRLPFNVSDAMAMDEVLLRLFVKQNMSQKRLIVLT